MFEGEVLFDRDVFPIVLPVVALLLCEPLRLVERSRYRKVFAGGVGVFLALITLALTANALSFDAATWRAAQRLVERGAASAGYIDAGLDWDGYHSPDGAQDESDPYGMPGIFPRASQLGDGQPCYVIASRPQEEDDYVFTLLATPQYYKYGVSGPRNELFVYRTYAPICH